jgi:glycosyltransferase involved in cell wall biosynthesis
MNVLQICSKMPFPPYDGGSIAMNSITQGLIAQGHTVKVFAISTFKHPINEVKLDKQYRLKTDFESVFIDTSVKPIAAFINLFTNDSYNIARFYSPNFEKRLIEILKKQKFDIIQLESLFVAPYVEVIRKYSTAKIILRAHNVEYVIWERLAKNTANPLKKWYLHLLANRLKAYEINMLNKYDAIASITEVDRLQFQKDGCKLPIMNVPFGIDLMNIQIDSAVQEFPGVFHLGSMDWIPNAEGIKWILEKVWLKVLEKNPDLKLYLAGRNMPQWLLDYKMKNVIIVGEVDNSKLFINSKSIMLVPLFSGGGMRVKIIEGMAYGKTIISTSIGAEGIVCEHGENIMIANDENAFADAIVLCANNKVLSDSLSANARKLIETKYDNNIICEQLSDFYKDLLK